MASPSIPEGGTSSGSHDHVPTSVAATTAPTATVDQPAGDADSGVPRWQQNLSGVWAVDPARSDKPYEMLAQCVVCLGQPRCCVLRVAFAGRRRRL